MMNNERDESQEQGEEDDDYRAGRFRGLVPHIITRGHSSLKPFSTLCISIRTIADVSTAAKVLYTWLLVAA